MNTQETKQHVLIIVFIQNHLSIVISFIIFLPLMFPFFFSSFILLGLHLGETFTLLHISTQWNVICEIQNLWVSTIWTSFINVLYSPNMHHLGHYGCSLISLIMSLLMCVLCVLKKEGKNMVRNPSWAFHILLRLFHPSIIGLLYCILLTPLIQVAPLNCIHDGKCVEKHVIMGDCFWIHF
jgi:hypothetical protein